MVIKEFDYIKPYDDEFMVYDYNNHRYVLTVDGALESKLDMVLIFRERDLLQDYLELLSRTLYSVFLKNKDSKYHDKQLWLLGHSKHFRKAIFNIFMDVMWYNFRSGGFLTLYQSGINLNEMKVIELKIENAMSVVGNNFADITGINERVPRYRISKDNYFDTLSDLKQYLINENIYDSDYLDTIDNVNDIETKTMLYVGFDWFNDKYYVRDFKEWHRQLELKGREW